MLATLEALCRRLPPALGDPGAIACVGRARGTWIVTTSRARLVIKRLGYERPPRFCARLLGRLAERPTPACPALRHVVEEKDHWYALFDYVEGTVGPATRETWRDAFALLADWSALEVPAPECELTSLWLDRLSRFAFHDEFAQRLVARLARDRPTGPAVIAHGDFSAQNFCVTPSGLVLYDWEEMGAAPAGFDAGWVLAQHRLGVMPDWRRAELASWLVDGGVPRASLDWYEGLGLARMLFRSLTLPIAPLPRPRIVAHVRDAIASWQGAE